jgi:RimJ/RimL family protein N-acetyltransferase
MADPREYAASETLKNGLAVTIRALRPDDRERIARAIRELDPQSIYLRLFSQRKLTEAALDRVMRFDPASEIALLATIGGGEDETVIGGGRYVASKPGVAEIAFTVEEDYHGQGIASRLLRHLARLARDQGIDTFEADVLAENKAMRAVFEKIGWPIRTRREDGTVHLTMALPDVGDSHGKEKNG